MCGIGGILYNRNSYKELLRRLKIIENTQAHRGPDDQNIWIQDGNGLCHQRLSIIDIKNGKQPMIDNSGRFVLTYNGELYNYKELRKELSAQYSFTSNCDSEVVLAAYQIWGKECLNKFIGMFSFLIWDAEKKEGFAARDQLGVKPFVYSRTNKEFLFASETKALLPLIDHTNINKYAFAETIVSPSLSGVTDCLIENISYLQAGCYLEITESSVIEKEYANAFFNPLIQAEGRCISTFRKEFAKSISYSLESDVPVGCFLSGGLDSSYIAAQVKNIHKETFNTYGIAFEDHNEIDFSNKTIVCSDDMPYANAMAEKYKLTHTWVEATKNSIILNLINIAQCNDRISVWEQEIAQHFLSKRSSKDVKVVLVGDAADEMNYGYFFLLNQENDISPLAISNQFGLEERFRLLNQDKFQKNEIKEYLYEKYREIAHKAGHSFSKNKEERFLATSSLITKLWLGRLLHNGDIHTMNHSLEARVPFANQNLVQISRQISPLLGFKNGNEKHIVRKAAQGTLIDKIRLRKKSALPRDPRLGMAFQKKLHELLQEQNPFIDEFLNRKFLQELTHSKTIHEQQRMMLFSSIATISWGKKYMSNSSCYVENKNTREIALSQ